MWEKMQKLLDENNVSVYKLSKEAGVERTMFSKWKKGEYQPKVDKLQKIADYFGVPVNYFFEGRDFEGHDKDFEDRKTYYNDRHVARMIEEINSNPGMKMLFDASRDLSEDDLQMVIDLIRRLKGI